MEDSVLRSVEELEDVLTEPSEKLITDIKKINGDILILGVGGKMGPSLAKLAKKACEQAGININIIGVSRFSNRKLRRELEDEGIKTIAADLLEDEQLFDLPSAPNVIYMAGQKFGTTGHEHFSWVMNTYLPGRVAIKFKKSRIVVFSTGNVYPLVPLKKSGASETDPIGPLGEYAQSCLGRERVFTHYSLRYNSPCFIFRLNYAIDLRYGVLIEIAKAVKERKPIDLTMGHVNVIWQGDANEIAIRALLHCQVPPNIVNITGPEIVAVRWLADQFGEKFGIKPNFVGEEESTALLANASKAHSIFGYPRISLRTMVDWIAYWVESDYETLNKPTHFQEREGKF